MWVVNITPLYALEITLVYTEQGAGVGPKAGLDIS